MESFNSRRLLKVKIAGEVFVFRPSSLRRILANNELEPALYQTLTAEEEGVETTDHEKTVAQIADLRAFESCLIKDACISHTIVLDYPGEESQDVWVETFTETERAKIVKELAALNNVSKADIQVIAPFRDSDNDQPDSGIAPDSAVGSGG